jgi:V-type H+-transporting ATPase subunit E
VRQETSQIDAQYDAKYKHASMAQQIAASNLANKSRLRILNARQQVLEDIFDKARKKLPEVQNDKAQYGKLLKNLILEVSPSQMEVLISGTLCSDG